LREIEVHVTSIGLLDVKAIFRSQAHPTGGKVR